MYTIMNRTNRVANRSFSIVFTCRTTKLNMSCRVATVSAPIVSNRYCVVAFNDSILASKVNEGEEGGGNKVNDYMQVYFHIHVLSHTVLFELYLNTKPFRVVIIQ